MTVSAQQRIVGVVMDETSDAPIAATTVRLESDSLPSAMIATTDPHGAFSFPNLSPGPYTLRVAADTFYPREFALNLRPRDTAQLTVKLTRISNLVESVVVQAEHKLLDETQAATVTNLNAKDIESLPAARRTQLTDVITPYVSSAVAGHDNFVHLRGNELSLNTFINGVSFFDNPHQIFTPGISPDIVQSVNVFTGGFPAEFGNRFGGILDIVTRGGFDANGHGSVTVGGGNFLRNNIAFDYGGHTKKLGYFFYSQGFESDRFLNTPELERLNDKGTGSRTFAQFDYRAASNDTLRLVLTGDGTNFQLPNTAEDQERGRDFFERNREQTAIFSWEHAFSPASMLITSAYERFASSRLVATNDPGSIQAAGLRNDIAAGVKSDYSLFLGSKHAIKIGIDVAAFRLREDFSFDPRDNEVDVGPFDFRGRKNGGEQSAYIQDKIRVTPNFTAELGIRFDHYSLVMSGQEFSPRINLAYSLNKHRTVLHFAYNRFFAPPSIEDLLLSARLGFDGLPPQISRSNFVESGVSQSITDKFVVRATAFCRPDENSFENTELANVRIFAPTTFAKGRSFGLEISGQIAEIPKTGLSGYFSYTAQRAFQTGPVSGGFTLENVGAGDTGPAAFDQIHTAVAGVTERHSRSGVFATAQFEYGSGTPAALPDADGEETLVRLPAHFVTNLYFGIDLFRKERHKMTLQFNVENVGNRVYQIAKESEFTPIQFSPPRFLSGSLKVRF
ncbi:MAG: TonB-dependent receptor [Acidobacteriota bacterium]